MLLQDIRRRLRCDTCGRRNQRLLVGYDQAAVPDGRPAMAAGVTDRLWDVANLVALLETAESKKAA